MDTQQQKSLNVLLIGETCQDEFHYGQCTRLNPEAPVPVLDFEYGMVCPGMAANVRENLDSFGCIIDFVTNDQEDIKKIRYIDKKSGHQLLRVDHGVAVKNPLSMLDYFIVGQAGTRIPDDLSKYDVLIISDYDKGFLPYTIAKSICEDFKDKGKIFVDSKKKDLSCFENAIIKINEYEDEESHDLPNNCELIVTLGKRGAMWNNKHFPAPSVSVYDVTGAGDVFLSTLAVCNTLGDSLEESIKKAVKMASISVQHAGTYKVTQEDINEVCG